MVNLLIFLVVSSVCWALHVIFHGGGGLTGLGWAEGDSGTDNASMLLLAIPAMLVGIVAGVLYDALGDANEAVSRSEILGTFKSRKLVKALLVSPIVYYSLVSNLREIQDVILGCVFAFQNGFFWQKTLASEKISTPERRQKKKPTS